MTNPNAGTRGTADIKTSYPDDNPSDAIIFDVSKPELASNVSKNEDAGLDN